MNAKDLASFRKVLLSVREKLAGNVNSMEDEALKKSRQDAAGDLSNVPFHMADLGTDNYERDLMIHLIQNGEEELKSIDAALEKLEDKTFGICEVCDKKITKARLMARPYAKLCLGCQQVEELEAGAQ
ncbi:MAG: TraR/DksA family transcriptional regulator [Candidatus Bathyanammoxibius sp.]